MARKILRPQHALIFEVLAGTGCRISECLGLRYRDHQGSRLILARTWAKKRKIKPPKSFGSRRTIEIAPDISQAIDKVRCQAKGKRSLTDFIFATRTGTPIDQNRVRSRMLSKVIEEAGVSRRTLHEIRHSHAVILLEAGTPLKVVQERLGHKDPATTLKTYSHVTTRMEGGAVAALMDGLGESEVAGPR